MSKHEEKTVKQLRVACRRRNLSTHGTKAELVARLNTKPVDSNDNPSPKRRKTIKSQNSTNMAGNNNNSSDNADNDDIVDEKDTYPIICTSNYNDLVYLVVNGKEYVTSTQCLANHKECNHPLSKLKPNNKEKPHYVECDHKYFEHILDFLRFGILFKEYTLPFMSYMEIMNLKKYAKLFGLYDLIFDEFDKPLQIDLGLCWNDCTKKDLIISRVIPSCAINQKREVSFEILLKWNSLEKCKLYLAILNKLCKNQETNLVCQLEYNFTKKKHGKNFTEWFGIAVDFDNCIFHVH